MIIVWDFNGTILDDVDLCIDIENKMMRDHGYGQVTRDRYLEIFRFPVSDYYLDLGVDFNDYSYEQISIDFHKDYRARRQEAKIMDDFHDTIRKAKRLGYGNVILSASREDILIEQCEELGIREEFDELLGINDLYASSKVGRGLAFKAAHPD
ncbi:MAG: HAD hydrolase-like protein, partial [Erysipelotrichaceae bacterium]|nr:HAD hydrolase-like protein [Erysipelotrichaceae bacterium]